MEPKKSSKSTYIVAGAIAYLIILLLSCHMGMYATGHPSSDLLTVLGHGFTRMFEKPFDIFPIPGKAFAYIGILTVLSAFLLLAFIVNQEKNRVDMPGKESGSAKWNKNIGAFNKQYTDPVGTKKSDGPNNMILSQTVSLNMDTRTTLFNNNILVIGGSGSGKSRFFVKPNVLQANANFVITDPAGEMLASMGKFLEDEGYEIRVFNLVEMEKSHCYNPFNYIQKEEDVLTMIDCFILNTTPPNTKGGEQFWVKSETALLQALCFYLIERCPKENQNFGEVVKLLNYASVDENNPDKESQLDRMFSKLRVDNPASMAVKSYDIFKMGAGKTLKSILISAGVRLQVFNLPAVANLTSIDTIDLASLGTGRVLGPNATEEEKANNHKKKALFVITKQTSDTYNFLVSMLYSQLFETLYTEGNKLIEQGKMFETEIRFLLDEFVNIGQIPQFTKKLATMRKYRISCSIIIQNLAQLKPLYEDWETIVGNCDTMIFLGGLEYSTLEYISNILGTTTIRTRSESRSRGKNSNSSLSYQKTQRKLLNPDEVGNMKNYNCIIKIRSLDPFMTRKYNYPKHPKYKLTGDFSDDKKYINTLNNRNYAVTKDNAALEAQEEKYKRLRALATSGKNLFLKEVPLSLFVKTNSVNKASEIFEKYSLVEPVTHITPEQKVKAQESLIQDFLCSVEEEQQKEILRGILAAKKGVVPNDKPLPLEAQINSTLVDTMPESIDNYVANLLS